MKDVEYLPLVKALLALVEQYRNDMVFPNLAPAQRQRRIEAIDGVLAKARKTRVTVTA